jgi:hypothetical protein
VGNFITDAMVILLYLKIYHRKKIFLENLPWKKIFYGNISMEIDIMGKFPWIYGTMPW